MDDAVLIPQRFNGPPRSGQGGYSAGVVAGLLGGPAEVTLRRPIPLDTELSVARDDGASLRVLEGDALVMEARSDPRFQLRVPDGVTVEQAHDASRRYRGSANWEFGHCFVCGLARDDSFEVFAGAVDGRELVASPWIPLPSTADSKGHVRPEFVWAVLDCPTYFALYPGDELPISVLARLTARVDAPVRVGEEHIVISWPLDMNGRKRYAGAAVLSAEGEPLAVARALMIEPRDS